MNRCILRAQILPKSVFGQGSAPNPAGGAYDAHPDPLVEWGGGHLSPFSLSTPSASRASATRFSVGPPRCEVRRAHQMVNPALRQMFEMSSYYVAVGPDQVILMSQQSTLLPLLKH